MISQDDQREEFETKDASGNNNYAIRLASNIGYVEVVKRLMKCERVDPSAMILQFFNKNKQNQKTKKQKHKNKNDC